MDISVVMSYLLGVILLYFIARLLYVPLKSLAKLIFNAIIGGLMLAVLNLVGSFWGLYLAINPITALIVGLLGLPGVLLLVVLRYWVLR